MVLYITVNVHGKENAHFSADRVQFVEGLLIDPLLCSAGISPARKRSPLISAHSDVRTRPASHTPESSSF